MRNYNSFILLKESKAFDKKVNKMKEKIKKFANFPGIYDWSIEKCTSEGSTDGLQYAIWVSNILKNVIIDGLLETIGVEHKDVDIKRLTKYITLGKESDKELTKYISDTWDDVDDTIIGFQEAINENINYVLDWFKSPLRTEKINLNNLSFDDAHKQSKTWHESLKATGKITDESGKILIEFDDGYYWIDLQTTSDRDEADAMGHCGTTNEGSTLFSLRDKNKQPHVTVAYDEEDNTTNIFIDC